MEEMIMNNKKGFALIIAFVMVISIFTSSISYASEKDIETTVVPEENETDNTEDAKEVVKNDKVCEIKKVQFSMNKEMNTVYIYWDKHHSHKDASDYVQISYSLNKDFKGAKNIDVKYKAKKKEIKSLKKGKKYYFRLRIKHYADVYKNDKFFAKKIIYSEYTETKAIALNKSGIRKIEKNIMSDWLSKRANNEYFKVLDMNGDGSLELLYGDKNKIKKIYKADLKKYELKQALIYDVSSIKVNLKKKEIYCYKNIYGGYYKTYKFNNEGKLKEKISYERYLMDAQEVNAYYSCIKRINGKKEIEISEKEFHTVAASYKKLKSNKLYKNTAKNRKKYV